MKIELFKVLYLIIKANLNSIINIYMSKLDIFFKNNFIIKLHIYINKKAEDDIGWEKKQ